MCRDHLAVAGVGGRRRPWMSSREFDVRPCARRIVGCDEAVVDFERPQRWIGQWATRRHEVPSLHETWSTIWDPRPPDRRKTCLIWVIF